MHQLQNAIPLYDNATHKWLYIFNENAGLGMSTEGYKIHHGLSLLNKVFMAYFMNEASNYGVDFFNTRPTEFLTKRLIGGSYVKSDRIFGEKSISEYREFFDRVDIVGLNTMSIEDFFDESMRAKLTSLAKRFSDECSKYPNSDYIFSELPDYIPFQTSVTTDCETNFTARLICGRDFCSNETKIVFDFTCVIIDRYRDCNGLLKKFEDMTPEEREKYDVQKEDGE